MMVTGLGYDEAADLLKKANGHVKTALVMALANVSADTARDRLEKSEGFIRKAIQKA
jgi:N-acetylmuramic acid 6-phosphate etherase